MRRSEIPISEMGSRRGCDNHDYSLIRMRSHYFVALFSVKKGPQCVSGSIIIGIRWEYPARFIRTASTTGLCSRARHGVEFCERDPWYAVPVPITYY